jgi:1-aminocyclopropane-1-carboxylate deaminase/D-cysteine desulfhydrase-like pyridoxal-dependent ACC family enzyme
VSAALELAEQIEAGVLPPPRRNRGWHRLDLHDGGVLVGLELARRLGIGFRTSEPELVAVRVTPWPVTSRFRILRLAERTARLVAALTKDRALASERRSTRRAALEFESRYLGHGYGRVTPEGQRRAAALGEYGLPPLDTTYSAKAAAAFLEALRVEGSDLVLVHQVIGAVANVSASAAESSARAV